MFNLLFGVFELEARCEVRYGGCHGTDRLWPGSYRHRGVQPVADWRCFWGFREMVPFRESRDAAKRGGAGTISERGAWESGNSVATGSTKVRTTSVGDIGEDCRDL